MTALRARRIELALGAGAVVAVGVGVLELVAALGSGAGLPTSDFAVFRAGGELALRGGDLYDRAAQQDVMRALLGVERSGGHLAFLLPPHGALLFAPFALLPLGPAFALFALLSAALLARLVHVLADLARADVRTVALVVCALGPVHATFRLGQLAILCALALAELARALREGRDVRAGIALAVLALKPQFVPVVALFLVGAGRWRALGVCAVGGLALVVVSSLALGSGVWLEWLSGLGALEDDFAVATPPYMLNARGTLARWLGDPERRALATHVAWALFALAGLGGVGLGARVRRAVPGAPLATAALASALALSFLFSPHLFFHDLLSWSVPVALARGVSDAPRRARWDLLALATPVALLTASALEPALGMLLPVAPQLAVPLGAACWLVRDATRPSALAAPSARDATEPPRGPGASSGAPDGS